MTIQAYLKELENNKHFGRTKNGREMLDRIFMVNLNTAIDRMSESGINIRSNWYYKANRMLQGMADRYSLPFNRVVGVCAVISPNLEWSINAMLTDVICEAYVNKETAQSFLNNGNAGAYSENIRKAFDILTNGASLGKNLSGFKVEAFFDNLLQPHVSKRVTVDTWVYRIAFGLTFTFNSVPFQDRRSTVIEAIIADRAAELNIMPHELQAALWEYMVL